MAQILTIRMRQVRFWGKPQKPKFRVWPFRFGSVRFGFFKTETEPKFGFRTSLDVALQQDPCWSGSLVIIIIIIIIIIISARLCLCMYTSRFHRLCTNIKFKCVCVCVHVKPEVDSSHVVTFSGSERLTPGPGLSSASSHSSLPRRDPPSFSAYQQSVRGIRLRYNFLYYLLSGTVLVNCRVLWVLRPLSP